MRSLDTYWYSKNPVALALWPLSLLFRLLVWSRQLGYKTGLFKSYKASKPVIVIGNISVGGTGKTPLIIDLCQLLASWGYKPGVISRGYGGTGPWPHQLDSDSDANHSGDEPVQIYNRTEVAVVVGPDRVADVELLLANNQVDIVLSDDGLQHYRLQRELELVVIDQQRKFGNGFMLPAGPLREPVSRLKANSWCIYNGGADEYSFTIVPTAIKQLSSTALATIDDFKSDTVHAVAGIGNPLRFFTMLREQGLTVIEHAFPDHYQFNEDDLEFGDNLPVLMTEKDSVKCKKFSNKKLWYVAIDIQLSEQFKSDFKQQVTELING